MHLCDSVAETTTSIEASEGISRITTILWNLEHQDDFHANWNSKQNKTSSTDSGNYCYSAAQNGVLVRYTMLICVHCTHGRVSLVLHSWTLRQSLWTVKNRQLTLLEPLEYLLLHWSVHWCMFSNDTKIRSQHLAVHCFKEALVDHREHYSAGCHASKPCVNWAALSLNTTHSARNVVVSNRMESLTSPNWPCKIFVADSSRSAKILWV